MSNTYTDKGVLEFSSDVSTIGPRAFREKETLTSISIPATVSSIGHSAFTDCSALTTVTFEGNNIQAISESLFQSCISLTNIILPSSIRLIYTGAFAYCKSLTSLSLPSGLQAINYKAIRDTQITSITIPSSVTQCSIDSICNSIHIENNVETAANLVILFPDHTAVPTFLSTYGADLRLGNLYVPDSLYTS